MGRVWLQVSLWSYYIPVYLLNESQERVTNNPEADQPTDISLLEISSQLELELLQTNKHSAVKRVLLLPGLLWAGGDREAELAEEEEENVGVVTWSEHRSSLAATVSERQGTKC